MSLEPTIRELRDGLGEPLVLVHPTLGDSRVYAPLARCLRWRGPILGVDSIGLETDASPSASIAEMAIAARNALGCASTRLAGWGVGGVVAAEMASRAADAGEVVAFLGLFDARAPNPEMQQRASDDATLAEMFVYSVARHAGLELDAKPASLEPSVALATLRDVAAVPAHWTELDIARRTKVFAANVRALFRHRVRRITTAVTLFEAEDEHPLHRRPPTLGWEPFADEIRHVRVPGTHFTLLAESRAEQLAVILDGALSRAD